MLASHIPPSGAGGGMFRYVVELARALAERDDVELHVVCAKPSTGFFESFLGAGRAHALPALPTVAMSVVERELLDRLVLQAGFDVVHGTKHLLPRRSAGARRLLTVHDMMPMDRPADFRRAKRTLIRGPYFASIRSSDVLVSVSAATRDRLCAYLPEVADRVRVVPLAPSQAMLRAAPTPVEGLVPGRFVLVVGDPSPRKNLALLTQAWAGVRRRHPDAVLAILGPSGWGTSGYGSQMAALQEAGAVRLLGHVDDGALRWAYEHAAVVALPSLLEGFGLPATEAVALGTPLLTSEDPALCEVSGAGGTHLSSLDVEGWERALNDHLTGGAARPALPPARTWAEVAAETVAAVRA
ncbi:glycosyltransferase family 4 protein [Motilibacter deserti]|uniref:Glycosyltransferase family 4 protein n=1 Tax=Motilibacter deserti TaxID=2714956 RepID=A0ABX0GRD0_9ACTN|nr:glycosyltransferase family 1 protein [Motilibacter deserti]NHC13421.1 glycosyltransferase family 4 protein [Motilibacter deserti]